MSVLPTPKKFRVAWTGGAADPYAERRVAVEETRARSDAALNEIRAEAERKAMAAVESDQKRKADRDAEERALAVAADARAQETDMIARQTLAALADGQRAMAAASSASASALETNQAKAFEQFGSALGAMVEAVRGMGQRMAALEEAATRPVKWKFKRADGTETEGEARRDGGKAEA